MQYVISEICQLPKILAAAKIFLVTCQGVQEKSVSGCGDNDDNDVHVLTIQFIQRLGISEIASLERSSLGP